MSEVQNTLSIRGATGELFTINTDGYRLSDSLPQGETTLTTPLNPVSVAPIGNVVDEAQHILLVALAPNLPEREDGMQVRPMAGIAFGITAGLPTLNRGEA